MIIKSDAKLNIRDEITWNVDDDFFNVTQNTEFYAEVQCEDKSHSEVIQFIVNVKL